MAIQETTRGTGTVTTKRAQKRAAGMSFTITDSSLGRTLVARNDAGITAVLIGDVDDDLRRDIGARFTGATLVEGGVDAESTAARVVEYLDSPDGDFRQPLDPQGTDFQRLVWRALLDIPAGATATYGEIAARIGRPESMRAVAGACAANPIAVIVPCHRVISKDGAMTGYRWGIERKRSLLERERKRG